MFGTVRDTAFHELDCGPRYKIPVVEDIPGGTDATSVFAMRAALGEADDGPLMDRELEADWLAAFTPRRMSSVRFFSAASACLELTPRMSLLT